METHKEGQGHLDELFNKARQEKPLLSLDEVKSILPVAGQPAVHSFGKGFHFSISSIVVGTGIVVSSFLSYMVLVVDKQNASSKKEVIEQTAPIVSQNTPASSLTSPVASQVTHLAPPTFNETSNSGKAASGIQQQSKNQNLLASADNKLIIPSENRYKKIGPLETNKPSAIYYPAFEYNGKKLSMKIRGDEVLDIQVNGESVPLARYGEYKDAIKMAKDYIAGNSEIKGKKESTMDFIDKQLRAEKILKDENRYVFLLTSSQLLIDGQAQDEKLFAKYVQLYKDKTGKDISEGDEYKFNMKREILTNKDIFDIQTKGD